MADIFNEIDEELRKDKAAEWWKRYGMYVVGGVAAIVAAVAGYTWYEQDRIAMAQAEAEQISQAVALFDQGDAAGAAESLQMVANESASPGAALLARLSAAGGLARSGDSAGAASLYDAISGDTAVSSLYRDLAEVFAVLHYASAGGDRRALLTRLEPQTADAAPWRFTARMVAASLSLSLGERDTAEAYLQAVADDDDAPSSARGQAAEILRAFEG